MKASGLSVLHQRFPRVPLRLVLIVPFVLQTVGAVGLVAYFSYRSGQKAVEDLAYQLMDVVGDRINHQLEDYFEIPLQINQLNANAVQLGQLDVHDESALEFRLWNQLMQFESVGTLMFLSPEGRFLAVNRVGNPAGVVDISTADFAKSLTVTSSQTDEMGRKQEALAIREGLDPRRDRPWYRQAIAIGKPGWSPVSQFADTGLFVINAYYPVYEKQTHTLAGVFSVNVTLNQISQFLTSIDEMRSGEVFILAPDGQLIASSADSTPFTAQPQVNRLPGTRFTPEQSQSALIREAHQAAQQRFGSLYWLRGRQRSTLRLNGDRYFWQTFPFAHNNGLNWQVVVLLPESQFMGQIYGNLRTTMLLSGGTLGLAIALGLLTARWIARPIHRLSQASRALTDGFWESPLPEDSLIEELQTLSQSFNQTALQLQSSLHQAKTALAESEAKFTKVFQNSPDPICITAAENGRFLDVNESFTRFSGYSRAEILNRTGAELNLSLNPEQDQQLQEKLAQTGMVQNFEYEYCTKSGRVGTTLLSLEFIELDGQVCVLTVVKDISDRKQLERALQASEARLGNILDSAIAAVTRLRVYPTGAWEIDHISAGSEAISGYTPDELKANINLWTQRILPVDWQEVEPKVYADIFAQRTGAYEYRFRHKNETVCWFCQTNISIWDANQNCWLVTAVTSDITARKQTEALLATRERYLVALAQTQRYLLADQDSPVNYEEILQGLGKVASASRVMLFSNSHRETFQASSLQAVWCAEGVKPETNLLRLNTLPLEVVFPRWAATLAHGGTIHGVITGFPEPEQALLQAAGICAVLLLPLLVHGEVEGFVLFVNEAEARPWDLSEISFLGAAIAAIALYQERKQTEAALYESEATNRALIQSIPDLLIRMDCDGKYLNILNTGEVQLYKPENAQVGRDIYEILPFSHAQQRMHYAQLALQTGTMQSYEYDIDIDGRMHYEEARIIPCGENTVLVIVRNVSERRLAEEQLRKTEQWLQQFSRQAPANIYTVVQEPDGLVWFEYISSAVEAMQEVTVEAVMADAGVLLDKIHPEDRAGYLAAVTRSGETLEPFAYEWRTVMASGQVKWLQGRSQPERRSNGAIAWYGVVIDVTEQKHTEQALQQALQEVETHFEDSPLAILQWDRNYRILRWSKQAEQIFGWTAEEVIGRTWQDITLVYQEDLERVLTEITPLLQAQINNCKIQNRNYTKDGRVIDCEWYSSAVFDDTGKLVSVLSFAQDVTERKYTEEALRQSEQLFREAFATSAFGISVRSPEGGYLQVNQAFCNMLGYTEAELLQLDYRAITYPDDQSIDPNNTIHKLVAGEIPYYHLEKRFLHKDGSIVWGLVSISLVRDLRGQPLYFVALIHNITDRKQAEAALTQSEERFRSAFHSAPIGMALIGLNDRWLRVNSVLCRMLDFTEAELLSRPGSSLVHPEDVEKLNQCILQTFSSPNRSAQAELRYLCREGRIAWGLLSLSLVRDPQGQPLYCVAQIQDITERRAVDRMKKEFISIVSHELRTPLTAMQGALGLLMTGIYDQRPDSAKRMIQIAHQNSDRLVRLVNDILDLERLESGKIELVKTACDVQTLLQQAVEGVQAIADTATVQMVIEPVSAQVWASSDAILQTLTNLLSNAIKFSPPHTVIHLSAHPQLESVLFEVRDQGRGIPDDKLNTIFEKFQQVDVSDSRQKGGTGLGLAICRSIIQQHGGEIWAESSVGNGSTFYFTLPIPEIESHIHYS